jgi:hypothetical protein
VEGAIVGVAVVESLRATKCEATAAEMLRMDLFNLLDTNCLSVVFLSPDNQLPEQFN